MKEMSAQDFSIFDVKRVCETTDVSLVNEMLGKGWKVLNLAYRKHTIMYALGITETEDRLDK